MTHPIQLNKMSENLFYAADGRIMGREYGAAPNGNPLGGRWVLRSVKGDFIDFDQHRHDLAERNGLCFHY